LAIVLAFFVYPSEVVTKIRPKNFPPRPVLAAPTSPDLVAHRTLQGVAKSKQVSRK